MKTLFTLNKYFIRYKWYLISGVVCVTLTNVFAVYQPIVVRKAFDAIKEKLDSSNGTDIAISGLLVKFALLVIGLALLRGLFMFLMRQTLIVMSRHIEFDQRNEIYNHYQQLELSFYKKNNTGDLMARVTEDISRVRMYVGPVLLYTVNLLVLIIMVVYTMFNENAKLAAFVLMPLPLLSFTIYYVNTIIEKRSDELQKKLSQLTMSTQEILSGIRVIKAFVQNNAMFDFFKQHTQRYRDSSLSLAKVESIYFPVVGLLVGLSTVLIVWVGGYMIIDKQISAGNIAEFVLYVNMLIWPVTSLGWVASTTQRAIVSQRRILEFLNIQPSVNGAALEGKQLQGSMEFKNVSFTYDNTGIEALKNISFKINTGEHLAILGHTGSGKTTLAQLLLRMYEPSSGEILLDGVSLKDINPESIRKQTGYVPQDVFLFSDTVEHNICFGIDQIPEQNTIEQYANIAGVHDEIMRFSDGYKTVIGERGVTLSGGQKQRISIARALIKQPQLLLFDDCLSAVDEKTGQHIFNSLQEEFAGKSVILITHRVQQAVGFDKIIVLENGSIAESGTAKQLMETDSLFKKLQQQQTLELIDERG